MRDEITVTIAPERNRVRLLGTQGGEDILKAVLGPIGASHPRAVATLLEGLSLWYEQPLSVVLCADELGGIDALGLCDQLGFGHRKVHYQVGIATPLRRRGQRVLPGLGSFRDLRQLSCSEWDR